MLLSFSNNWTAIRCFTTTVAVAVANDMFKCLRNFHFVKMNVWLWSVAISIRLHIRFQNVAIYDFINQT